MRKYFSILPLFYSCFCFAQSKLEYANFIQTDTSVKWAAIYNSYVNLTPVSPNFNLRNFYLNKLKQQGVTNYLIDTTAFRVTPVRINYEEYILTAQRVNYDVSKMNWQFDFDERHDASEIMFNRESNTCDTCFFNNRISFFKVKQLLYYRNNRLKIQNILLTPVIYKKQAQTFKEETEYFEMSNFAFNEIKNEDAPIPASAKFIGRSCNILSLLPSGSNNASENNILTLDNWNLSILLYKDIKRKKIKAYDTNLSIYPDQKSILDSRKIEEYKNTPIDVPYYDSLGNMVGSKKMMSEINFDSIYNYKLIQDFYFDFDKEILYSKLISLAPRIKVITSQGIFLGFIDYWGIIFPEEKKLPINPK